MLIDFLPYFSSRFSPPLLEASRIQVEGVSYPVRGGIPRFTADDSYSTGNFSLLRDRHSRLQLDSQSQTSERRTVILDRTGWPVDFFFDKTVLECGCGAGPDTEVLLSLGSRVLAVDIAGVDVALANLGPRRELCLIQADISSLPLLKQSFDIVFCHRVLQHTPNPATTLRHILSFVKPGGAVFVHSYSRDLRQMLRWKYLLRPITTRMNPEMLYRLLKVSAPLLHRTTNAIRNYVPFGRHINWVFVPYLNYAHKPKYRTWSTRALIEYGLHDTFDALSARYDSPVSEQTMRDIGSELLDRPFAVRTRAAVTLMTTIV